MKRALLILALLIAGTAAYAQEPAEPKAEPSAEAIEKQEKQETKDLIYKTVNFAILAGLIVYFLRKPAADFFASRTAAIQKGMADAKIAREAAEKRLAEIEARLARLGDEIGGLRAEAAKEDAVQAERMKLASDAEGAKILASAESEIDTLTRAARLELKSYAAQLAVDLAEVRIKERMSANEQEHLLQAHIRDLSGGKN
jgi:F-type H+-transporting ATPase subunit b